MCLILPDAGGFICIYIRPTAVLAEISDQVLGTYTWAASNTARYTGRQELRRLRRYCTSISRAPGLQL